jgi:hypothetical protein
MPRFENSLKILSYSVADEAESYRLFLKYSELIAKQTVSEVLVYACLDTSRQTQSYSHTSCFVSEFLCSSHKQTQEAVKTSLSEIKTVVRLKVPFVKLSLGLIKAPRHKYT